VVLAADALGGSSPASGIVIDHSNLPDVIAVDGVDLQARVAGND
jgi:FAD/FMN-containing dehydrogenase